VKAPLLGYLRTHGQRRIGVLLNTSAALQRRGVPSAFRRERVLLSTHVGRSGGALGADLLPDEAVAFSPT